MDDALRDHLDRLHAEGAAFDARQPDRLNRRRNLEPDTAHLVWTVLLAMGARDVVEIGTSNGYSTLWWADAVRRTGGTVVSVDTDADAQDDARRHLAATGLLGLVELRCGDGGDHLARLADGSVDVVFLDAERTRYPSWWPHPVRVLRPHGLLLVDNAVSHADELRGFVGLLEGAGSVDTQLLGVGKGLLVACRTT